MSVPLPSYNPSLLLVALLTHFDRESLAQAGGKGVNLGELIKAGFDVPPGFVITTALIPCQKSAGRFVTQFNILLYRT